MQAAPSSSFPLTSPHTTTNAFTNNSVTSSYFELNESLPNVYVVGQVGHPNARIIRIVHISDTHGTHYDLLNEVPMGHIFIHSGDFGECKWSTRFRKEHERDRQLARMQHFFQRLPHPYKIFVPGNEDFTLESLSPYEIQRRLSSAIYLHDNSCTLFGLKFYGSPWNVAHGGSLARGFSRGCSKIEKLWGRIPDSTDVLITHMDPWCSDHLYQEVAHRIRPIVHLFGDDLEGSGIKWKDQILFSNGAMYGRHACHGNNYSRRMSSYHRPHRGTWTGGLLSGLRRHKSSSLDRRYVNLHSYGQDSKPNPIVIDVYVVTDNFNYVEYPHYLPPTHLVPHSALSDANAASQRKRCRQNSFTKFFSKSSFNGPLPVAPVSLIPTPPSSSKANGVSSDVCLSPSTAETSQMSDPLKRHSSLKCSSESSSAAGSSSCHAHAALADSPRRELNSRISRCIIS